MQRRQQAAQLRVAGLDYAANGGLQASMRAENPRQRGADGHCPARGPEPEDSGVPRQGGAEVNPIASSTTPSAKSIHIAAVMRGADIERLRRFARTYALDCTGTREVILQRVLAHIQTM